MPSGFELEGRLAGKMAPQSGRSARGDWARQDILVEVSDGTFPTTLCMSVWGADRVKELEKFPQGAQIKVSFNLSGREYNGRWYTDIKVWRIVPAGAAASASSAQAPLPPPPPLQEDFPSESFGEDLPF